MVLFHHKQVRIDTAIDQYIKVDKNIKITAFEKKKINTLLNIKGPGSALTWPWPDPPGPGLSQPGARAKLRVAQPLDSVNVLTLR